MAPPDFYCISLPSWQENSKWHIVDLDSKVRHLTQTSAAMTLHSTTTRLPQEISCYNTLSTLRASSGCQRWKSCPDSCSSWLETVQNQYSLWSRCFSTVLLLKPHWALQQSLDAKEAAEWLLNLSGAWRVVEYSFEFYTIAAGNRLNKTAIKAVFLHGLKTQMLTELGCQDEHLTLDSLIDMAIRID